MSDDEVFEEVPTDEEFEGDGDDDPFGDGGGDDDDPFGDGEGDDDPFGNGDDGTFVSLVYLVFVQENVSTSIIFIY